MLQNLERDHEVLVVDFNKRSFVMGAESPKRFVEVFRVLSQVATKRRHADRIYLTISESLLGNLKDLVIYALCLGKLSTMTIHLHGGSIKRLTWDRWPLLFQLNRVFLRRIRRVILSGRSHVPIFDGIVPRDRLYIVPNFAPEYLFASETEIEVTFATTQPLRILYISNFIREKGYPDLLNAYESLDEATRGQLAIDFAGRFDNEADEKAFRERIRRMPGVRYHGLVNDELKRQLFVQAHVFCLPTMMFEGQPISILEAYAAGCVVVTTGQPGIRDVFAHSVNGIEIEPGQPASLAAAFKQLLDARSRLLPLALANNRSARARYREAIYTDAVRHIVLDP